jgi:hypothetical protein
MLVWLRLTPWLGMKIEIRPFPSHNPSELHLIKRETAADNLVLAEFAFGTLAGVISFVAAVITTVVEVPGPWRSFWLLICIVTFACAVGFIVEGTRNFGKRE